MLRLSLGLYLIRLADHNLTTHSCAQLLLSPLRFATSRIDGERLFIRVYTSIALIALSTLFMLLLLSIDRTRGTQLFLHPNTFVILVT